MRITFSTPLVRAILAGLLITGGLSAKPLAQGARAQSLSDQTGERREIRSSVSTSFGIYQPYPVPRYRVSIGHAEPAVASNFSNIAVAEEGFAWNNFFSAAERSMLLKNGFVVRPEAIGSFGQAYSPETSSHDVGSFITVDALLHGLRVSLTEATRDMEKNYALPTLSNHLASLSEAISKQLKVERNESLSDALVRLLGYVQTAQALLSPSAKIDPRVESQVRAELTKIRGAAGETPSTVLPQQTIDYSLFAPRGHYKLDNQLASYYKAKVWLSHVGFHIRQPNGAPDLAGVRTAALLARMIDGMGEDGYFKETLRNINEPSAFFAGGTDRLAPWEILTNAMRGYYGRIVEAGPGFLADDAQMVAFIGYLREQLPEEQTSDRSMPTFRLIEWQSAPSNDHLNKVWSDGRPSLGSYGMTVMAAMGNLRAAELLGARSSYARGGGASLTGGAMESWVQDMDHTILYTVQPLLLGPERGESYPRFMRNEAWRSRELSSALGTWADYRHTPATMAMQTVIKAGSVGSRGGELATSGYVEPNPEAWARVASLAAYIRNGLTEGRGERLIGRKVDAKLQDIETTAAMLMQIAALELDGKDLTPEQLEFIKSLPQRIAAYETFADKALQGDGYVVSAGAARINSSASVANGHPMMVYVIVPRNDGDEGLMLTRGAVYSYYEVNASDEEWLDQISTPGTSVSPDTRLVGSFVSSDRGFAQDASKFLGVSAALPAAGRYTPTKGEQLAARSRADLTLEKSVVSRGTTDELWFTVRAPSMEGTALAVTVADAGGQSLTRAEIGRIKNGERLDVIRVGNLGTGQYFIRVEDLAGKVLATGRFMVTR